MNTGVMRRICSAGDVYRSHEIDPDTFLPQRGIVNGPVQFAVLLLQQRQLDLPTAMEHTGRRACPQGEALLPGYVDGYSIVQMASARRMRRARVSNTLKIWFIFAAAV